MMFKIDLRESYREIELSDVPSQLIIDLDFWPHHLEIDVIDQNLKYFSTQSHSIMQARFPLDLI